MGLVFFILRYATEVRQAARYFEDLEPESPNSTQVALAQKLIEEKTSPFDMASFADRYQTAVLEVIRAKVEGTETVVAPRPDAVQFISLMDALRKSVAKTLSVRRNGRKKIAVAA